MGVALHIKFADLGRLEGILLMTLYFIIAIAAWFYPPGMLQQLSTTQTNTVDDPATNNAK